MAPKPFHFPAKRTTAIFLLTAATAAIATANSDDLSSQIHGIVRTARAVSTVTSTVVDYEFSLRGLQKHSDQYRHTISQVHQRSAKRFLKLCEANKGFYVKAGQFIASQKVIPREYSSTLSVLQDQVSPLPFEVIEKVLKENLGPDFSEKFLSIDERPIGAASIAQVHHAVLKSGQEVAIKVQYPWIEKQMHFDTRTMYFLSKTIGWLYPQYRFGWLPLAFAKTVSSELDFVQEARNSERAAKNFRNNKMVRIPHVFWELTTKQVLTMQFYAGHKVAKSLFELFAEMIFVHGYMHGDPHPGNILVSPEGRNGFSLVLLDHAVYRELDEEFRKDFCQLWEALVLKDSKKTMWFGERFGAGKYSRYLPIIFTGTTIESKYSSGMSLKEKESMKHELKSLLFEDLSSFMESMPPDFIAILRVDALLRSTIRKMDVSRLIRLLTYTKYAVYGRLCPKLDGELCKMPGTNVYFAVKAVFLSSISTLKYIRILIKVLFGAIFDSTPWQQKVKNVQNYLYRKIGSSDFWGILVHSAFLLFCIHPNALF
ncbi:aarF domain-containing protein kinase 1 isoform X2 [Medicago truncatula]|uniref:aarF domain-containing protein kinase 1 isoform X2 n=1 Tax=Medicago truncatula TaxID=3880 RepID=UPI000D2F1E59|nr:aarF domain-containing protein kinase 1 isoform X2 [Medicago truncatula]